MQCDKCGTETPLHHNNTFVSNGVVKGRCGCGARLETTREALTTERSASAALNLTGWDRASPALIRAMDEAHSNRRTEPVASL